MERAHCLSISTTEADAEGVIRRRTQFSIEPAIKEYYFVAIEFVAKKSDKGINVISSFCNKYHTSEDELRSTLVKMNHLVENLLKKKPLIQEQLKLLLRWLWKIYMDKSGMWAQTMQTLYSINEVDQIQGSQIASYFIKSLLILRQFYNASVEWVPQIRVDGLQLVNSTVHWRWTSTGKFSTYIMISFE
ncbi:retinoblastoma-related protein [Carex littledalei]|uniref:Retinoblastoma-related protein n=1 Tax=Carex littledalei TaxID=544730 RepID=A0A833RWU8_9POAL|nr:retinoblastoma-related protein [Carex littledalei]